MATTTLIQTVTVGAGGAASIDFTSIPQTYTDLMLVVSARSATADRSLNVKVNGSSSGYSGRELRGYDNGLVGSTTSATTLWDIARTSDSTTTANTFGSYQIYLPNYAGSTNKNMNSESVEENNSNTPYYLSTGVGLWSNTAAITSISILPGSSWAQYSTASLYGITKATPLSPTAKATGGTITYDSFGMVYHTFTGSGTFTPTTALTADVLLVAGGGGGGYSGAGGGGAGGVLSYSSVSLSATGYTVTIGGGGAGGSSSVIHGQNGSTSQFTGLTSPTAGGGGGALNDSTSAIGNAGGSGGGGAWWNGSGSAGGSGVAGQGYAGGSNGGGGGGAGGVGAAGSGSSGGSGGVGGIGTNAYSAWAAVTSIGVGGYIAGGGGGAGGNTTNVAGGSGGGGTSKGNTPPYVGGDAGVVNTGSGGGGGLGNPGGAGGSGVVVVRYLGV